MNEKKGWRGVFSKHSETKVDLANLNDQSNRPQPTLSANVASANLASFKASGLFSTAWYLSQNQDVVGAGLDPLTHFLQIGWKEGRKPNPMFDPLWYQQRNADVASSGMNPLVHYWSVGERQNRQPCSLFETEWYRAKYASEIGGGSPLVHYLSNRHTKKFSPNRYFDVQHYLERNPDVANADIDPLEHFVTTGYREGRTPSLEFDSIFYTRKHLRNDSRDPITHYIEIGRIAGFPLHRTHDTRSTASEVKRFTSRAAEFEELDPDIVGAIQPIAKLIAFYLPQFHSFPENDRWWGKGFTEWSNVSRGCPRFVGHYQPRVPRDFGFYDLSNPDVMAKQVGAAKTAGVHGFCFYYYNFNGKRLLEKPIDSFLSNEDLDFPFCLMWANENWTRRWDGADSEVLIRQDYKEQDDFDLIDDIARHFADKRYIKANDRPIFLLYRADIIPGTAETIARWRKLFASRHGVNPLILMAQAFDNIDPRDHGLDGAFEFPPHKLTKQTRNINADCEPLDDTFSAQVYRYDDVVTASISEPSVEFPLIKTVVPSWDNDARRQGHGLVIAGSTPSAYAAWLERCIDYSKERPFFGENFVFINAWNEWAEGAYLEPDLHFGGAYLNATARTVSGFGRIGQKTKILLVGHDAFPAGAQQLLLNLGRTLRRQFGMEIEFLLCGDGDLAESYSDIATTHVCSQQAGLSSTISRLTAHDFKLAITNTLASGVAVTSLKEHGFKVVSLVHELPRIVKEKNLFSAASAIAQNSDVIVFPVEAVRDAFLTEISDTAKPIVVRPQGLYQKIVRVPDAKAKVLDELQLPPDTKIVLNIGFGDLRKGIDLFCAASQLVSRQRKDVVFVWVGRVDVVCATWIKDPLAFPDVRFVGQLSDVSKYLSAADVFALTSREDPYPSVALEAMSLGVPVLAFEGSGGVPELIRREQLGETCPYADVVSLSEEILKVLEAPASYLESYATRVRAYANANFAFDEYAQDLIQILKPAHPKVSVIVPNYNYSRYLRERLGSIFGQTASIFEIIVLDDASTDESISVLEEIRREFKRDFKVVANAVNSGNVFSQWLRGVEMARGDLVWIAEADDIAHPDFLSKLVASFSDSKTLFAFSDSKAIDAEGVEIGLIYKDYYSKLFPGALSSNLKDDASSFARRFLSQRNLILNVSGVVWRRDCLLEAINASKDTLKKLRLAGDWLLYLTVCKNEGSVVYSADQLNYHRRHASGVTSGMELKKQVSEIRVVQQYFEELFGSDIEIQQSQSDYIQELNVDAH